MARIRYLKPEFFSDEDLAEISFQTRLAFAGLWCFADKAGRLEDRPKFLKAMIFPYDSVDMEKQIEILTHGKHENGVPFIQRYEVEGKKFIQIISWDKHQKPHHTEKESHFPPAPPLIKGMEKRMEKQLEASAELKNGEITVKKPLDNFHLFWEKYPIKKERTKAFKEWEKNKPDIKTILPALKAQIEHKLKCDSENTFCPEFPYPERWIKNRKWEDEILKIYPTDPPKPVMIKCKFCGQVYKATQEHQCQN